MTLCYIMPRLIGQKVRKGDEMWKNFVRLIQITILATSPYADIDTVGNLSNWLAVITINFKFCILQNPLHLNFITVFIWQTRLNSLAQVVISGACGLKESTHFSNKKSGIILKIYPSQWHISIRNICA